MAAIEVRSPPISLISINQRLIENDSTLSHLVIRNRPYDTEEFLTLTEILQYNTVLTYLDLHTTSLKNNLVSPIFNSLILNSTLKELNLASTDIDEAILPDILNCLKKNTTLKSLSLSGNNLGSNADLYISEIILYNSNLTTLNLCSIGNLNNVKYISHALTQNTSLSVLDLSFNKINEEGGNNLDCAIYNNPTMERINIACNLLRKKQLNSIYEMNLRNKHNRIKKSRTLFSMLFDRYLRH